ncbi:hypothetical protein AAHA92_32619 [Salvia divinorum]|uniref:Uncharacterized protein n=1 Tax=Salvia divinorum TaxID=28513 RepID=A0ABD1FLB9_SALDI
MRRRVDLMLDSGEQDQLLVQMLKSVDGDVDQTEDRAESRASSSGRAEVEMETAAVSGGDRPWKGKWSTSPVAPLFVACSSFTLGGRFVGEINREIAIETSTISLPLAEHCWTTAELPPDRTSDPRSMLEELEFLETGVLSHSSSL